MTETEKTENTENAENTETGKTETEKVERRPSISQKELKLRARAKNKKPAFVRAESWKYDRFSVSWRKPKGLDNKIRRKIKGWPAGVSVGYKGPKIARGLHPSGYREVIVFNVKDLSTVEPETQAARIAHTVGKRKRALIIAEAKKLNIKVLNFKVSPEAEKKEEEEAEGEELTEEQKAEKEEKEEKEMEEVFEGGETVDAEDEKVEEEEETPKDTEPETEEDEEKQ
jgi:large subunit ribosomal protein L32e